MTYFTHGRREPFTEAEIRRMHAMREAGNSMDRIAKVYHLSRETVRYLLGRGPKPQWKKKNQRNGEAPAN